jgi:K+-transporting ATPase ATPase A chain
MNALGIFQIVFYMAVLATLAKPLGAFMAKVYRGERTFLSPLFGPLERGIYRLAGVDPAAESNWKRHTLGVLLFNFVGLVFVYLLQRLQGVLPLNPQGFGAITADSSFNTAVSFVSNTNWQGYGGEATMSYLTQMLGLGVQNFVSAASGMAVLVALIRSFVRKQTSSIGNFWVDLTRSTVYVLLPLSVLLAVILMSQGVVQTFSAYQSVDLVESVTIQTPTKAEQVTQQTVPLGPAASQIAIKQLGTNGGGFFNVNSAHPFENPTPLSNFLEVLAILLIPAALCYTFGKMVHDTRQGWAVMIAMLVIFVPLTFGVYVAEQTGNPVLAAAGADTKLSHTRSRSRLRSTAFFASPICWRCARSPCGAWPTASMPPRGLQLSGIARRGHGWRATACWSQSAPTSRQSKSYAPASASPMTGARRRASARISGRGAGSCGSSGTLRRRRSDCADAGEPARQRDQVHAGRDPCAHCCASRR